MLGHRPCACVCVDSLHREGGTLPACEHFLMHMWERVRTCCSLTAPLDVVLWELCANRRTVCRTLVSLSQLLQAAAADRQLMAGNASSLCRMQLSPRAVCRTLGWQPGGGQLVGALGPASVWLCALRPVYRLLTASHVAGESEGLCGGETC